MDDSVSILNLEEEELQWISGPSLPKVIYGTKMIQYLNSIILIGNHNKWENGTHMFKLSSPDGAWVPLQQTFKQEQWEHISFLVPDDITDCS